MRKYYFSVEHSFFTYLDADDSDGEAPVSQGRPVLRLRTGQRHGQCGRSTADSYDDDFIPDQLDRDSQGSTAAEWLFTGDGMVMKMDGSAKLSSG